MHGFYFCKHIRRYLYMQTLKHSVQKDLLTAARAMFLRRGFQKTSMRDIAQASGICLSNIYNYFKSKDALFCAIVHPAVEALEQMLDEHHGRAGVDVLEMRSEDYFHYVVQEYVNLLTKHNTLLRLLFFRAQGSSLGNYKEAFAERSTKLVKQYFQTMKERHPEVNIEIPEFYIQLHTVWMFALLEEIIRQRVKPKDVEQIITEYMTGEIFGWRKLMKI